MPSLNPVQKLWVNNLFDKLTKDPEIMSLYGVNYNASKPLGGVSEKEWLMFFERVETSLNEAVVKSCPISLEDFGENISSNNTALVIQIDKAGKVHLIAYNNESLATWTANHATSPDSRVEILEVFAYGKTHALLEYNKKFQEEQDLQQQATKPKVPTLDLQGVARRNIHIHAETHELTARMDDFLRTARESSLATARRYAEIANSFDRQENAVRKHQKRLEGARIARSAACQRR